MDLIMTVLLFVTTAAALAALVCSLLALRASRQSQRAINAFIQQSQQRGR